MLRIIQEVRPVWVVAENVRGLLSVESGDTFEEICSSLERIGYAVQTFIIPACAVNAPHRRDRLWIVANSNDKRHLRRGEQSQNGKREICSERGNDTSNRFIDASCTDSDTIGEGLEGRELPSELARYNRRQNESETRSQFAENWLEVATRLCTLGDGLSEGLVRPKGWRVNALKAAGNTIIPQIAFEIFKAIENVESKPS